MIIIAQFIYAGTQKEFGTTTLAVFSFFKRELMIMYGTGVYVCVVVQFYPWFKFSFLLFQTHYHVIIIHYHTQKQKKRKFEPRIKLNHNICKSFMSYKTCGKARKR